MKRSLVVVLIVAVSAGGIGCATIFKGADTPGEKLSRVLDGIQAAVDGLSMVQRWLGVDLLTVDEKARFDMGFQKAKEGLVEVAGVVAEAVERHDRGSGSEIAAIKANAEALP